MKEINLYETVRKFALIFGGALLTAFASGCAITTTANVTLLGASKHAATVPAEILVYMDEKDIPLPFERIGLVEVVGDWKLTTQATFIQKAKEEAAKLGANALLLKAVTEPTGSAKAVDVLVSVVRPQGAEIRRKQDVVALYVPALKSDREPSR